MTSLSNSNSHSRRNGSTSGTPPSIQQFLTAVNSLASSHMYSTVTRLLVTTKELLESQPHGRINESCVSDIYMGSGNEYNASSLAFSKESIDMNDLNLVPDDLREYLEAALSEDASPMTLEQHLPQIGPIVGHLLKGLKVKHQECRAAKQRMKSTRPIPQNALFQSSSWSQKSSSQLSNWSLSDLCLGYSFASLPDAQDFTNHHNQPVLDYTLLHNYPQLSSLH
ncbi:uncharacterized protein MELLADRAFT_94744 [Melampsora larici-populina 98AG31]|uniref:Aip3p/Bud6 N-terminal domain-containing protein n=1 Tax=Melampsora larici-populina (strain 98AG31 / pathotype 3-4-7) TaxID=747676 RepID=F4S7S6_MELLP|nr:uncharacterized protein MELLADRAFT_94744 [Melampsora larici-populina 98AG31]EGF99261.1 hypothetical protein MELLADRAFT_94744 [Melampsora larici-populina 98AG31]